MTRREVKQDIYRAVSIHNAPDIASVIDDDVFRFVRRTVSNPLRGTVTMVHNPVFNAVGASVIDAVIDEVRVHTDPTYTDE